MTKTSATLPNMTRDEFEAAVGAPLESFSAQCHAASIALVRSGVLGEARVARGTCAGVGGQHSWVVLGTNCYNTNAKIVDPTLWSYDKTVEGIWEGRAHERPHLPFGFGNIFLWARPIGEGGEEIKLEGLSPMAESFLGLLGPLDRKGWVMLAHAPVNGWPSKEIFEAMYHDPQLAPLVPIDIIGMVTDLNPSGLYLREEVAA